MLVTPYLEPGGQVFVGDSGAGTANTKLLDTEEFIGLVNLLDDSGFHPTVNHVWRTEFGPGYATTGHEPRQVNLATWNPMSPAPAGLCREGGRHVGDGHRHCRCPGDPHGSRGQNHTGRVGAERSRYRVTRLSVDRNLKRTGRLSR